MIKRGNGPKLNIGWAKRRANSGSTMVEVLVAFVVLAIILVSLFQVMKLASNMEMESVDSLKWQTSFQEKYYTGDSSLTKNKLNVSISVTETDANGEPVDATIGARFSLTGADVELLETIDESEDSLGLAIYTFVNGD